MAKAIGIIMLLTNKLLTNSLTLNCIHYLQAHRGY